MLSKSAAHDLKSHRWEGLCRELGGVVCLAGGGPGGLTVEFRDDWLGLAGLSLQALAREAGEDSERCDQGHSQAAHCTQMGGWGKRARWAVSLVSWDTTC